MIEENWNVNIMFVVAYLSLSIRYANEYHA